MPMDFGSWHLLTLTPTGFTQDAKQQLAFQLPKEFSKNYHTHQKKKQMPGLHDLHAQQLNS